MQRLLLAIRQKREAPSASDAQSRCAPIRDSGLRQMFVASSLSEPEASFLRPGLQKINLTHWQRRDWLRSISAEAWKLRQ
jgi:hypothetical protein